MAIADYLRKLVELKNQLVVNLQSMGVAADESEKLNTLVPKILDIETGVDTSDATATATDILKGKTAYVNDVKVTGTLVQNVEFVEGTTDFTGTSNLSGFFAAISKVNIPDGTTSIGDYAFYRCSSLTSIKIPDSVTSIGSYAFYRCTSLSSITIPDSVTSIGSYAFQSCYRLESITIPDSVTSIGSATFSECTSLAHIYYTGTQEQWNAITKGDAWNQNMGSNVSGGTKIHYNYIPNKEVIK